MKTNNYQIQSSRQNRYIMIGETGSVYLSLEKRYPEKGEVIKLSKERADVLLTHKLIAPFEDAQETNKE